MRCRMQSRLPIGLLTHPGSTKHRSYCPLMECHREVVGSVAVLKMAEMAVERYCGFWAREVLFFLA